MLISKGEHHRGIILTKQLPIGETITRLAKFLFSHSVAEMKDNFFWINAK